LHTNTVYFLGKPNEEEGYSRVEGHQKAY